MGLGRRRVTPATRGSAKPPPLAIDADRLGVEMQEVVTAWGRNSWQRIGHSAGRRRNVVRSLRPNGAHVNSQGWKLCGTPGTIARIQHKPQRGDRFWGTRHAAI